MQRASKPGKPPRKVEQRRIVTQRPDEAARRALSIRAIYTGNPLHKRSPGDFKLNPPAAARPNKTLCDAAGIFRKRIAQALLRKGIADGLWDVLEEASFPKIVWCVFGPEDMETLSRQVGPFEDELPTILGDRGAIVLEAQLENAVQGHYHGYPLLESDSFRDLVLARHAQFAAL